MDEKIILKVTLIKDHKINISAIYVSDDIFQEYYFEAHGWTIVPYNKLTFYPHTSYFTLPLYIDESKNIHIVTVSFLSEKDRYNILKNFHRALKKWAEKYGDKGNIIFKNDYWHVY